MLPGERGGDAKHRCRRRFGRPDESSLGHAGLEQLLPGLNARRKKIRRRIGAAHPCGGQRHRRGGGRSREGAACQNWRSRRVRTASSFQSHRRQALGEMSLTNWRVISPWPKILILPGPSASAAGQLAQGDADFAGDQIGGNPRCAPCGLDGAVEGAEGNDAAAAADLKVNAIGPNRPG